jgi:hypothetical protein
MAVQRQGLHKSGKKYLSPFAQDTFYEITAE